MQIYDAFYFKEIFGNILKPNSLNHQTNWAFKKRDKITKFEIKGIITSNIDKNHFSKVIKTKKDISD